MSRRHTNRPRYWTRLASLGGVVAFLYFGAKHVEHWTPPTATYGPASASCPRGPLTGEVTYVRDGDTIEVAGVPIRLGGLAAPESDEPGGRAATTAMRRMVDGRKLRCALDGERTYDRCVGVCYLEDRDIAAEMVRRGVARDCPRFSGGRYAGAEQKLRQKVQRSARVTGYQGTVGRAEDDHLKLLPEVAPAVSPTRPGTAA